MFIIIISSSRTNRSVSESSYSPIEVKTSSDILKEIKAREELEKKYIWVEPTYAGKYRGKIIGFDEVTPEMLSDIRYLRAQGKWEKRSVRKTRSNSTK